MKFERTIISGMAQDTPSRCIMKPFDGKSTVVALLGEKGEWPAGRLREEFYAGYLRELDGN